MSKHDQMVELINEMTRKTLDFIQEYDDFVRTKTGAVLDAMEADRETFKETGVLVPSFGKYASNNVEAINISEETNNAENTAEAIAETSGPKRRGRTRQKTNPPSRSSSLKENSAESDRGRSQTTGQRKALMEPPQNVMVKLERLTADFMKNHPELANLPMKREKTDMPPPTMPVRQTRKRKGAQNVDIESIQVKEELINAESKKRKASTKPATSAKPSIASRDSDVLITPRSVEIVNLIDSEEEEVERPPKPRGRPKTKRRVQRKDTNSSTDEQKNDTEVAQTTRVTRTKTRNAAKNKEPVSSSTEEDDKKKTSKRTKAKKGEANKKSNEDTFVREDAVPEKSSKKVQNKSETEEPNKGPTAAQAEVLNATTVLSNPTVLNATVVVEKPKNPVLMNETIVINKVPNGHQQPMDELMTDDEDVVVSPVVAQKQKKLKQVFSPYENSPVKKRVEAFEKLRAEAHSEMPPRMTRTKTRAKEQTAKENGATTENEGAAAENVPTTSKHGAIPKYGGIPRLQLTPLLSTTIPKHNTPQPLQFSGLKTSQAEFREREMRRRQKEAEALSKKEALIQAQTEERRRKREERQLKAQLMREALEKDKQKTRESADRQKQEKFKQLKTEREEKLLKQREEAARKRALAMKKAAEEKQREEERQKIEEKQALENQRKKLEKLLNEEVPPYLRYETPLLPTADCYDSDDSSASKPFSAPDWQKKKDVLMKTLRYMRYIDAEKRKLFTGGARTVNLQEIFPTIEPKKLKRTSSAIWNKSDMSKLSVMTEEDESYLTA